MGSEPIETPGLNGTTGLTRLGLARLLAVLGWLMGVCLISSAALAVCSFLWSPADWTTVNETRASLAQFARDLLLGFLALAHGSQRERHG